MVEYASSEFQDFDRYFSFFFPFLGNIFICEGGKDDGKVAFRGFGIWKRGAAAAIHSIGSLFSHLKE